MTKLKTTKTVFYCTDCGNETLKWQGQCPSCGAWNTIAEHEALPERRGVSRGAGFSRNKPAALASIDSGGDDIRFSTGLAEFDRALGGGAVAGSLILVGGEPGIGKSTLLLQLCGALNGTSILYVTGEESARQVKLRAERLNVSSDSLFVLAETALPVIIDELNAINPTVLIIDSIQTLYNDSLDSAPGSVAQVKDCTSTLMRLAKTDRLTVFIVSHVNKEGSIAGPKTLEHMVDCVLYFEGERTAGYRLLRTAKNRFGSTNEIGVFEMTGDGLIDVPNPSEMLLSGRPPDTPGTCVTCLIEGSRPILAEIQALVSPTASPNPRRNTNGIDYNRAALLLAVLERRGGLRVGAGDVFINVIGGLTADEPAADLAVILALASCYLDVHIDGGLLAIGEEPLTGELRGVSGLETRLSEAKRLGFAAAVVPKGAMSKAPASGLRIIEASGVRDALALVLRSPTLPSGRV